MTKINLKSYKYFKDSYNNKTHVKTILLLLVVVAEFILYATSEIMVAIYNELKIIHRDNVLRAEEQRYRMRELRIIEENSYVANRGAAVAFGRVNRAFARQDARNRDIDRRERQYARTFSNIANGRDNFMGGNKRW